MSEMWSSEQVIETWKRGTKARADMMGEATQLMLKAANVGPGKKVLDIAAGMGEQSMMAARMVGLEGSVVATDISESMLEAADMLAREEGITNISTTVMDAQELIFPPQSFDAAISRHGLMFIPNLDQTLSGVFNVLREGGAFAALVWSKAENNPAFHIPMKLLYQISGLELPKGESSAVFSLADPDHLGKMFRNAGFQDVQVQAVHHIQRVSSLKEFLLHQKEMASGIMGNDLSNLDEAKRSRLMKEIGEAFRKFEGSNGLKIPGESLLVIGIKTI